MYRNGLIQDNVVTEAKTSSSTTSFKLNTGFLNGLLFSVPEGVGESTITAKYAPADGSKAVYLTQNHPLSDFESLSDQKGGHDLDATRLNQELIKEVAKLSGQELSDDVLAYADRAFKTNIKLPLGDLPLKGSELEVTINWKWNGTINRTIGISRYESNRSPARLFVYEQSRESVKVHHDVVEMYLVPETATADLDINIKVQDDFISQDASYNQFHDMALNVGRYNNAPVGRVPVQIYGATTPIPSTVDLSMSGGDTQSVRTLIVKEILIPAEVSSSTIVETERLAQQIRTLERADPLKAQAYRHRVGLPKSSQLSGAINRIR